MKAYMFPGQGSQKIGMGAELFDKFSDLVDEADKILGYSLKTLCLEDPNKNLGNTAFTQPALFCVNHFHFLSLNSSADYYLGHSLGEYNALVASECLSFSEGLQLVKERGRLMSEVKDGGMSAIIGLSQTKLEAILSHHPSIDLANINAPSQIVVSGPVADLSALEEACKEAGASMAVRLNVSGSFHSRYLKDVAESFSSTLKQAHFSHTKNPVISNVTALPYPNTNADELLYKQIFSSVQWVKSIHFLQENGVDEYIEVGPGRVLKGLLRHIERAKN